MIGALLVSFELHPLSAARHMEAGIACVSLDIRRETQSIHSRVQIARVQAGEGGVWHWQHKCLVRMTSAKISANCVRRPGR
jgi:hypothetical protein